MVPDNDFLESIFNKYKNKLLKLVKAWNSNKPKTLSIKLDENGEDSWAGLPCLEVRILVDYGEDSYSDDDLCIFYLSNFPSACGILIMSDYSLEGYVYNKIKFRALVTEIVHEYAKKNNYGLVISTNAGDGRREEDEVIKKLDGEIMHKFKSPRTQNKVHVYIKDVTKCKKSSSRGITEEVSAAVPRRQGRTTRV